MKGCLLLCCLLPCIIIAQDRSFAGRLTVKGITTTTSFDQDGKISEKTETESSYSANQTLVFYPGIYTPTKSRLAFCSDLNATCNFISGNNVENFAGLTNTAGIEKKSPVEYTYTSKGWALCDNALKEIHKSEGGGSLTDYMVMTNIGFVKNSAIQPDFVPAPLIKTNDDFDDIKLTPLIKGDYSMRLYISIGGIFPNINPTAPKAREQYRDCSINEWNDNEISKFGISLPNFTELNSYRASSNTPENSYYSRYMPITETQVQNLLKSGSATFNLKYYSYSNEKDSNNKPLNEKETKIYVTLSIH